ncbi:hypothetical protein CTEN210_12711 [Chaetoceros tenuissimus]|uniref:histidine kinase n=1 Tax=Chaetoceros tenuissimus TaxID=426638 RepID=A0AAD3D3W9_9STRA|nr:hypothetical protein CTEN210_12711 [Chaetoceros tenuissimus]
MRRIKDVALVLIGVTCLASSNYFFASAFLSSSCSFFLHPSSFSSRRTRRRRDELVSIAARKRSRIVNNQNSSKISNRGQYRRQSSPLNNRKNKTKNPSVDPLEAKSPFPLMPSKTFFDLANSQFELLYNSIEYHSKDKTSKIKSVALYLPQENPNTGQLEFMPSLVFPSHPKSERIFIASDAQSGMAPTLPPTLTQLPGFSHAAALLPTYPFASSKGSSSSGSGSVGVCEEVFCDIRSQPTDGDDAMEVKPTALSLPLFSGPQTVGVLLVWGAHPPSDVKLLDIWKSTSAPLDYSLWTKEDKKQISRVGETLALALCMDSERFRNRYKSHDIKVAMADQLHQVKNPVQALRTFSKLLQRNLATCNDNVELSQIVNDMVAQSDRVVDLLLPVDSLVNSLDDDDDFRELNSYEKLLAPMASSEMVLWNQTQNKGQFSKDDKSMQTQNYLQTLTNEEERSMLVVQRRNKRLERKRKTPKMIENGQNVKFEMSFVPDVLESTFSPCQSMARDMGIDMEIIGIGDDVELPGVKIVPRLLQEAVINVLDNAIKYVKLGKDGEAGIENKSPMIRVTLRPNEEDEPVGVTILVEDNGPGIQKDEIDTIFERGYRGINTSNSTVGSGIGLDISKEMMGRIGGNLELVEKKTSDEFKGTVMKFTLYRRPKI